MTNLLLNPGFEEGEIGSPSHWFKYYVPPAEPEFMYPESGRSVSDVSAGIRFDTGSYIQSVSIDPTKNYMLSGYIKTLGIEYVSAGIIGIDWKDASGNWISKAEICSVADTTTWTQYQQIVTSVPGTGTNSNVPSIGTVFLELRVLGESAGTVWFDDILLEETTCDAIPSCSFIVE